MILVSKYINTSTNSFRIRSVWKPQYYISLPEPRPVNDNVSINPALSDLEDGSGDNLEVRQILPGQWAPCWYLENYMKKDEQVKPHLVAQSWNGNYIHFEDDYVIVD